MASADFSWQALLHVSEFHPSHAHETSPVKDILFPPYTRLIYSGNFRIAIGFHFAMDTLALGYTLPAIGRVTDLHRLENVRAGQT